MFLEVTFVTECSDAMDTFEWLFSGMLPNMPLQLSGSGAFIFAYVAFVWLLLCMLPPNMNLHLTLLGAGKVAEGASVGFILSVNHFVILQGAR